MKFVYPILMLIASAALCLAQTPNYQAVLGWSNKFFTPGSQTTQLVTTVASDGTTYVACRVVTPNQPDTLQLRKLNAYGTLLKLWSFPTSNQGHPRALKTDSLGDVFFLYDQLDQFYSSSTVLQGWDVNGNVLFSKILSVTGFNLQQGLALGSDSSNRVRVGLLGSAASSGTTEVLDLAFSRVGAAIFSANYPMYSTYAKFDSTGRMSAIGYVYASTYTAAGAVVFAANGTLAYRKTLIYTKAVSYYFGVGSFDKQGNYYLSTDTSTSTNSSSKVQCLDTTFTQVWATPSIPGFVYYGSAKDPAHVFTWGSSDAYYSTGYFLAFIKNGTVARNTQTATGNRINGVYDGCFWAFEDFTTGDIEIYYTPDPFEYWPPVLIGRISGKTGSTEDIDEIDENEGFDIVGAFEDPFGNGIVLKVEDEYGCFNYVSLPVACPSGLPIPVVIALNGPAQQDESVSLTASNGATFATTGASSETVVVPKGSQKVSVSLNTPVTNVDENVQVVAKGQGVVRAANMKATHAKILKITCTSPVTRGNPIPYTVTLDGEAGKGGVAITVTTDSTYAPGGSTTVDEGETSQGSLTGDTSTNTPNGTVVTLTATDPDGNKVTCTCTINQ